MEPQTTFTRRDALALLAVAGLSVLAAACDGSPRRDDNNAGLDAWSSAGLDGPDGAAPADGQPPADGSPPADGPATADAAAPDQQGSAAKAQLPALPQALIKDALAKPLIKYDNAISGAGTNCGWFGPSSTCLAAAALAGSTSVDAQLVQQLKYWTSGKHAPTFMGGYRTQHELHLVATTLIASRIPRIWSKISAAEKTRLDLCVKAALVANAFVASDKNPFVLAKQKQHDLRGGTNLNRDWGPNYHAAMVLTPVLAMIWLGGPTAAQTWMNSYSHSALKTQIAAAGNLEDLLATWSAAGKNSAPTASQIEAALKGWTFYGDNLAQHEALLVSEIKRTFGKKVSAGLNNGAGIWDPCRSGGSYSGKLISGAATLPNKGAMGMATELDANDGGGKRSAMSYAVGGYRIFLDALTAMIAAGYLNRTSAAVQEGKGRIQIGVTDLKYKTAKGYYSYSKGGRCEVSANNETWDSSLSTTWGLSYSFGLWTDVLKPYLDGP